MGWDRLRCDGVGSDHIGWDRMGSDGGKFGIGGISGSVVDVWGAGVRLGDVMGRAPLRGCGDPARCGERGDLGARIWGSVRDPWVARVGWVASPSLPQSMNSQQREELARREAEPGVKKEKQEMEAKAKQASPREPHPIPSHPNPISPCNRGCGSAHQHGGSAPGTLVGSEGIRGICAWYLGRI